LGSTATRRWWQSLFVRSERISDWCHQLAVAHVPVLLHARRKFVHAVEKFRALCFVTIRKRV
jgi:hypothetical protein